MPDSSDTYDQIPYPSFPSRRTHICHLAAIGRLFALDPPPPRTARVLELGCAAGGNLLPMAGDFPDARFLGIDLSARQIEMGRGVVAEVGFQNLDLRQGDLLELSARELGQFDYIICHGVYSWVPRIVQDRILTLGLECLAPRGIFYCSFNALPGWHLRGMVREMLVYHVAPFASPGDKIKHARALLSFLMEYCSGPSDVYQQILKEEVELLKMMGDAYMFHEHLEAFNEPLYFHQFLERVAASGLQYLGDTDFGSMLSDNLGAGVTKLLAGASLDRSEQYLDFLNGRTFRGALLHHPSAEPNRQIEAGRIVGCSFACEEALKITTAEDGAMVARSGDQVLTVHQPLIRAILLTLQEHEACWIPFDDLLREATARSGESAEQVRDTLADDLLTLYSKRIVRMWVDAPRCAHRVSERPRTTPYARWQARQRLTVTNLRHEHVRVSSPELFLLAGLDGSLDRAGLRDRLGGAIARGDFHVHEDGQPVEKDKVEARHIDELLDHLLTGLSQRALLAG